VLEVVDVDLPRPRTLDMITDPRAVELSAHIRGLLGHIERAEAA
jgi:hypothetical protein